MQEGDDTKDTTQSSGKRVMQPESARKRIRPQTAKSLKSFESVNKAQAQLQMVTREQDEKDDEPEERESETLDDETFMVHAVFLTGSGLVHPIKVVYKDDQLGQDIYPDLDLMFDGLGFGQVDGWDLLIKLNAGGEMSLTGPMFQNKPRYDPKTMRKVFMVKERALVSALMFTVFEKQANLALKSRSISCKVVCEELEYDTARSFRKTTIVFRSNQGALDDIYRVIIEGTAESLCTHHFHFQPSNTWLIGRFPEYSRR
jgi:hypothetical protein